ncbi:Alpha/Beta hydrolase protein [Rhypophila decipiens]|uniref:Alpha/Beta hydrolase protein n=1 Tax=Rhypophila decipiens TaxID=261697 RepID=A0AAN6XT52_9PEZI|nr:Alpha/Beta hydrolase protein [Rhypophila decipiens]
MAKSEKFEQFENTRKPNRYARRAVLLSSKTRRYDGEHIDWEPCGTIADHKVECSSINVPIDQFNSTNGVGKSFKIPLTRLRGENATKSILLNPGGPGGSGGEFLHRRGAQLSAIVGDGFHLLSFDPRGINQSLPRADCYPTAETRQVLSPVRSKKLVEDSGELWAWSANHGQACADNMGEYAQYLNTPQTAADMNSILDAIGQEDMYYWGFSYGTLLGQTYATLSPERSHRVIIDGVVNQFDWYNSPSDNEAFEDTDKVFYGFIDECIKAGPSKCALASLHNDSQVLAETLITSISALRDEPISVYINSTVYGILDYWNVWDKAIFEALYKPTLLWYDLAKNLASLLQGNATDAFLAYGYSNPNKWNTSGGEALDFIMYNDGMHGAENFPPDRLSFLDWLTPYFNKSMFAPTEYEGYFKRRAWKLGRTHGYNPVRHGPPVKTENPILILTTTYDPICPLISAKSALEAFEGSKLVEVKGYGHCSVSVPSMCLARAVRRFFYQGKMPEEEHTLCEVDGEPYFVKPESRETVAIAEFESEGERRIHLAQVELARGGWIGPGGRVGW